MPRYRGDFDVHAGAVLSESNPVIEICCEVPFFELKLRNGPRDAAGHVTGLRAEIVASVESISTARRELQELLAQRLDYLTFVTHSPYKIIGCKRIIEWEPHVQERNFGAYTVFDPDYPPHPELDQELFDSVKALVELQPPGYVLRALSCFRRGALEDRLEDQFQQFWFAMEVVVEGTKSDDANKIFCPKCSTALHCATCGSEPTRRLSGRQGIRRLIFSLYPEADDAKKIDRMLGDARNKLLHGATAASVTTSTGQPFAVIVNTAAQTAFHAILNAMPAAFDDDQTPLHFGHRDWRFARQQYSSGFAGKFSYDGVEAQPGDAQIPDPTVEIMTTLRPRDTSA